MARAIWKGSVSFGLVNIPVELHGAVRDHRPHFRLLHAKDLSPIHLSRVCTREGKAVPWEDLVKGYEYSKGRFVVLTDEDFEKAAGEKTHRVDIMDFVSAADIDDRFFETPYYVLPAKGGDHAYALLREAMRSAGRIGIAKIILRDAQHLAALEVIEDMLVLTILRFADELVDASDFAVPRNKAVSKSELAMAKTLVENLATEWKPEKYADEYRDNLMKLIKAKTKGKTLAFEAPQEQRGAEVVDLMERLRQSLARRERGKKKLAAARKPRKHRAA
jgi:DNA end-binding protein Ku